MASEHARAESRLLLVLVAFLPVIYLYLSVYLYLYLSLYIYIYIYMYTHGTYKLVKVAGFIVDGTQRHQQAIASAVC